MTPYSRPDQRTLYAFHRGEAWLWAFVGLAGALAIQIVGCLDAKVACTWQRLVLSSVCGPIAGLIVWCLHFPLRWWLLLVGAYSFTASNWDLLTGQRWPFIFPEEHYPLWLAAGVAGSFLYSRWLIWKFLDYDESMTIYVCFYGAFLGPLGIALGVWFFLRRWREKIVWEAEEAQWQADEAQRKAWQLEMYRRLQQALPNIHQT